MTRQAEIRSPRERYRDQLRRDILDAAREAFAQDGYEGVSMRKLAEKIGCSHANLYLHFKDKEALFESLVEESFDRFADGLRKQIESAKGGDPVTLLRKAGRAYVEFGVANPGVYEFAFLMRRQGVSKPHVSYERLRSLVQRCVDEKRFRHANVDAASQALWAAGHGIASLLILRPTFAWSDRRKLIGQVIDSAVDGLLA
ncbi:MAG TPA: TetR/AcrR family transcriptional regulator [Candidatus Polarisedimenticolaceae bacterium]|nr:TetR/AcrR family transcriptional regulator [Candidatus Polarisedimenticolaceae bacterium]